MASSSRKPRDEGLTESEGNEPSDKVFESAAETEKATVPSTEQLREGVFIKHLPHEFFGARRITENQWASIGIRGATVEWNEQNLWKLPKSMFTEEQLNYLLNVDDGFKIVEG